MMLTGEIPSLLLVFLMIGLFLTLSSQGKKKKYFYPFLFNRKIRMGSKRFMWISTLQLLGIFSPSKRKKLGLTI